MAADRYLKIVLTVIALELAWIGLRDGPPRVSAQQGKEPMPVVITGFRIADRDYTTLPVAVVGAWKPVAGHRELELMQPLEVRINQPLQIDARQPITVQTGVRPLTVETGTIPLSVQSVPARPGTRPGQ